MTQKEKTPTYNFAAEIRAQVAQSNERTVPALRLIRRDATRTLKTVDPAGVFELVFMLLSDPNMPKWLPYELLHHHKAAMAKVTVAQLTRLGRGLAAWDEVDPFACYLSGPAWREGRIRDGDVHRWARSVDRWWRRVAVVSTVPLNSTARGAKGKGDAERTLAVCEFVKNDRDDMVVKALSWALRELARKQPEAVRSYLKANVDCLAARVVREATNKLDTGLKNPRLKRP